VGFSFEARSPKPEARNGIAVFMVHVGWLGGMKLTIRFKKTSFFVRFIVVNLSRTGFCGAVGIRTRHEGL